jgi:hypothetical protein
VFIIAENRRGGERGGILGILDLGSWILGMGGEGAWGCGVLCTLFLSFLIYSVVAGRGRLRPSSYVGPPLHGRGWLIGGGVPMAQLVSVPRGQQEPGPYPNG